MSEAMDWSILLTKKEMLGQTSKVKRPKIAYVVENGKMRIGYAGNMRPKANG